jgi:hypothetical protein
MSTTKKFISLDGEERTMEEQIVFLSQTIRELSLIVDDNKRELNELYGRVCYLETVI